LPAEENIASIYAQGRGVPRDLSAAARWLRRAAGRGSATAQNNLGFAYEHGLGVLRDQAQAVFWYRKAAAQGLPEAQRNLALMETQEANREKPEKTTQVERPSSFR
ncbi:MAG TPA: tetratricopeptide repeat protein, partial [Terriglobales bacterium]|nr:tetratricopeptide repeat protein [Terriglobales bacterium]